MIELAVKAGEERLEAVDPEEEIGRLTRASTSGDSDTSSPPSAE